MKNTRLEILSRAESWTLNEEDGAYVRTVLSDRGADPEERLLALELAGDTALMDDEMAEAVLALLGDAGENEQLRGRAAIVLGPSLELAFEEELQDEADEPTCPLSPPLVEKVEQALRSLHDDESAPREVRRRCLEAAVRLPRDWQKMAIRRAYRSGDELWKITGVFCMQFIPGFDDQLLEALESDDPDLLCTALQSAGERALEAAWPRVRRILQEGQGDPDVLAATMQAAACIKPRLAEKLLQPYLMHEDPELPEAAEDALGEAHIMRGGLDDEAGEGDFLDDGEDDDEWDDDAAWEDEDGVPGGAVHTFPLPGQPAGGSPPAKTGPASGPKKAAQKKTGRKKAGGKKGRKR